MKHTIERISKLSPKRMALLIMELQAKIESMSQPGRDPIAVIGMGCRFPGGSNNPEMFWRQLERGEDAITEIPKDRWDVDMYYDPDPETKGKMYARHGGFIENVDLFDTNFFGIAPREAVKLEPQHRLLLEVCWEALENSAQAPKGLVGSQTGVFIGITANDYAQLLDFEGPASIDAYRLTGNPLNFAAGRLSYTFGFQGPAMAVDTACSSSLVAIHLACQSLRNGECQMAIAGGVNLILWPDNTITASKARMLARDGRCKTFDEAADGFVRSEGCGIVVLKRYSDALANGDNILALIKGSAVNQDGRSSGLTVPNGLAQQRVILEALSRAGVSPDQVSYVETHGTGTSLGDPIEVRALGEALCGKRPKDTPLIIGSVKTNIGHTESSAGIASLIKVVLSLIHHKIPPHINFHTPSRYIGWDELAIKVPTELTAWEPSSGNHRIAGVSAFGGSGTNAHVILEEAPTPLSKNAGVERPFHLLALSAKNTKAIVELIERYVCYFDEHPSVPLSDVCFSANAGRSHFNYRLAVVGEASSDLGIDSPLIFPKSSQ